MSRKPETLRASRHFIFRGRWKGYGDNMQEVWKDIAGYEGLYQVSNLGNVRSLDHYASNGVKEILYKGNVLKWHRNKNGYWTVLLCKKSKTKRKYIHRLVAEAFLDNADNLSEVNHKDENKKNNCVENLEWCTTKYNVNYGTHQEKRAVSRGMAVVQYDLSGNLINEYYSARKAASMIGKKYGSTPIMECCKGKRRTAYGHIWKYKDAE